MMPLALWAGIQAPECECPDGTHRFFCTSALEGGSPRPLSGVKTAGAGRRSCCMGGRVADRAAESGAHAPCKHCRTVPRASFMAIPGPAAPTGDDIERAEFVVDVNFPIAVVPRDPAWARRASMFSLATNLVITLRRLLI
jgi:hypothetical protein